MARFIRRRTSPSPSEIIARYPRPKSATDPAAAPGPGAGRLRHRRRDGATSPSWSASPRPRCWAPASFYEMFKLHPVGTLRRQRLHQHLVPAARRRGAARTTPRQRSGIKAGGTTADGMFTLEDVECIAACTEAPCLQVNYRYLHRLTTDDFDTLIDDLRAGRLTDEVPDHGTLARIRQHIPADRAAGIVPPERRRARRCGSPATSAETGASADADPRLRSPRPGLRRHRRPEDRHLPLRPRGLLHARAVRGHRRLRRPARRARRRPRPRSHDEVRDATLLGRGGAGFPAGVKWGFCPPGVWPRYLVVNGDETEPGTYKDRLLMERDPHQLIEGCLIACYAVGLSPVSSSTCAARWRWPRSASPPALNEAYAAGYVGKNILGTDVLGRHRPALGRRRLHRRRGDRAHREPRGQPGHAPPQAAVLPGGHRPLRQADHRQQRRDAVQPAVDHRTTAARPYKTYGSETSPGTRMFAVSGHVKRPGVYEVEHGVTTFRDLLLRRRLLPGHPRRPRAQDVHPRWRLGALVLPRAPRSPARGRAGRRRRLDARLRRHRRDGRDHRRGAGLPAGRAVLRPRVVRQVHAVSRGHHLAGAGAPAHPRRPRSARATSTCCSTSATTSRPGPTRRRRPRRVEAVPFPPKQTTICPLGPSSVAPITSAIRRFRDEFEAEDRASATIRSPRDRRSGDASATRDRRHDEHRPRVPITINGTEIQARARRAAHRRGRTHTASTSPASATTRA